MTMEYINNVHNKQIHGADIIWKCFNGILEKTLMPNLNAILYTLNPNTVVYSKTLKFINIEVNSFKYFEMSLKYFLEKFQIRQLHSNLASFNSVN